jgi:hypothetical protein
MHPAPLAVECKPLQLLRIRSRKLKPGQSVLRVQGTPGPMSEATTVRVSRSGPPASMATPTPATMPLRKATMLAVVSDVEVALPALAVLGALPGIIRSRDSTVSSREAAPRFA